MDGKTLTPEGSIERVLSAVEPTGSQAYGKPNNAPKSSSARSGGSSDTPERRRGDGRGCLRSTPQKTKLSPVFPVVGQLLQRHTRYVPSNGHSSR